LADATEIFESMQDAKEATSKHAFRTLNRLHAVVHGERLIARFEETSQDLDKVLNIFFRTNSGGTVLSHSDLLNCQGPRVHDMSTRRNLFDLRRHSSVQNFEVIARQLPSPAQGATNFTRRDLTCSAF
jgi:hypothetical protein